MVLPPPDVGGNLLTFPPFANCPQNNIQTHQSKHTEVQSRAGGEQVERETITHLTTKGRLIHSSLYVLCIKKNSMRIKILNLIEPNVFEWCFQASILITSTLIDWKSHSGQWLLKVTIYFCTGKDYDSKHCTSFLVMTKPYFSFKVNLDAFIQFMFLWSMIEMTH